MKQKVLKFTMLCIACIGIDLAAEVAIENQSLIFCVTSFREGYYQKTIDCIGDVLPDLSVGSDRVTAYKYLGLSYGMLNQIDTSKAFFKQARHLDTAFEIDTLEFPPNITLIYNQVILENQMARLSAQPLEKEPAEEPAEEPAVVRKKPGSVLPAVYASTAGAAAGAAGYFYYKSYRSYQDYLAAAEQTGMDGYYADHRNALFAGVGCSVIVPVALYLFFRKPADATHTGLIVEPGQIFLAWEF